MIEMGIEKDGVVLLQHAAKILCNSARRYTWEFGADSNDLHVGDGSQARDNTLKLLIVDHERIAAGQENVPNFRMGADILQASGNGLLRNIAGAADHAFPCAEAAVHGTTVGDQQEYSVGIPVSQSRYGAVLIFVERVLRRILVLKFLQRRNRLHPDRILLLLNEVVVVSRDSHGVHPAHDIHRRFISAEMLSEGFSLGNAVPKILNPLFHCLAFSSLGKSFHKYQFIVPILVKICDAGCFLVILETIELDGISV
jgi:hypothetical protein